MMGDTTFREDVQHVDVDPEFIRSCSGRLHQVKAAALTRTPVPIKHACRQSDAKSREHKAACSQRNSPVGHLALCGLISTDPTPRNERIIGL